MNVILSAEQYARRQKQKRFIRRIKLPLVATFLIGALSFTSEAAYRCDELHQLDASQLHTLLNAFHLGLDHGYGYSLAAIAWKESLAGKVKVNYSDPSFGVFHAHLTYAARREGVTSNFNKNILAQRLMDDIQFAASHAIMELDYWKSVHGDNNWRKIWASYNAGHNWEAVPHYAADIAYKIRVLQTCFIPKMMLNLSKQNSPSHRSKYVFLQSN
ncbi:hypothetical protein [Pseudoalteromonas umbrosa]|uniref:hypothetical protein n=1 Tax=Pseudoalteromonas umbrosa TaxID=3048489 RepID=UPI0024C4199D|nr:hypothetical protein [Pseudoalteromonas sp. B95]MDK1290160.1 hypothetical protein [Pseudoalteromonas sp. B95]